MTQIRTPRRRSSSPTFALAVIALAVGLIVGLALGLAVSRLSGEVSTGSSTASQPALQTQMRQVQLPSQRFLALVYGEGTDYPADQAVAMADLVTGVCGSLWDGASWLEIRDAVAEAQGWSAGQAGLFVSAAQITECARPAA